ncbi:permease [Aquibacillus rhizosphaerae]|uniref:Permease n=1 Tax=Aquibacillus rhizosphaerae TaxID=3051431 RepID=A0ABT7LCM3_9BACI|nr:permease [Aquibacillus sp. LR5S19]MDL4843007.1 permease [Aquibacillus sp. LR5S19]
MNRRLRPVIVDFTGIVLFGIVIYIISFGNSLQKMFQLPSSIYNMSTIFLSILIEALPFVLIGVIIAGLIQIFVTEDHIKRWIPKNKFLAVTMSCVVGACFPACECGIVPIVRRLIGKGVPIYAGVGFLLTGPLINPIVIMSTFMAFGNDLRIAASRMIIGFVIALVIALIVSLLFKSNQLKHPIPPKTHTHQTSIQQPLTERIGSTLIHAVDEFFDMGKYLIIGCLFAAFIQTYVSAEALVGLGDGLAASTVVMMGLAYLLSLCSEADAFIAASFKNLFPTTAILGFLIYGPMMDLKNTFMLLSVFNSKFVFILISIVTGTVFSILMLIHGFY